MIVIKAAILAGGKGTRIEQLYPDLPKPMIPILDKPLLQQQIEKLVSQGFKDITLIVGYKSKIIQNYFGNGEILNAKISYIIEDEPLGTGGALTQFPLEDTLIIYGDIYCDIDFNRFVKFHYDNQADITLFTHPNSHPYDSDIVIVDDNNRVTSWKSKKDKSNFDTRNLVNAGMYVFSKNQLPRGNIKKLDLEHEVILPKLSDFAVYSYHSSEYVKDMGTPERLYSVEQDILNNITSSRSLKNKQRAVFIDRDGTINEEDGFITNPNQINLIKNVSQAIKLLNNSTYLTICITNQPVIARGDIKFEELDQIHARLDILLGKDGAYIDDIFVCPHHPDKGFAGENEQYKIECDCRKPKAGLLYVAAQKYNIDLKQSYMIGDRTADITAGKTAGCKTIGVKTGTALLDGKCEAEPDFICNDLYDAVKTILNNKE